MHQMQQHHQRSEEKYRECYKAISIGPTSFGAQTGDSYSLSAPIRSGENIRNSPGYSKQLLTAKGHISDILMLSRIIKHEKKFSKDFGLHQFTMRQMISTIVTRPRSNHPAKITPKATTNNIMGSYKERTSQ